MTILYTLTAAQSGTRVKIESPGTDPIQVIVGDTSEAWVPGNYIEIVRISATAALTLVPFSGVILNTITGFRNDLVQGEHARVTYLGSGVWDLEIMGATTINGGGNSLLWHPYPGSTLWGAPALLQANGGTTTLSIGDLASPNSRNALILPTSPDTGLPTMTVSGAINGQDAGLGGGLLTLKGGDGSTFGPSLIPGGDGGNVLVTGGNHGQRTTQDAAGGNVMISAGPSDVSVIEGGFVSINTNDGTNTLTMVQNGTGAIGFISTSGVAPPVTAGGALYGARGDVLTSGGPTGQPSWTPASTLEVDGFSASSNGNMNATAWPGITLLNFDEGFSIVGGATDAAVTIEAGQVAMFLINTLGVMNQNNNLAIENTDTSTKEAPAIVTVSTGVDGRSVFNLQKAGWYRITANLRLTRTTAPANEQWYDGLVHFGTSIDASVIGPNATRHSTGYTPGNSPSFDYLAGSNYSPTGQRFRSISDQYIVRVTAFTVPSPITIGAYVAAATTAEDFDIYGTLIIERLNGAVPKVSF